MKRDSVNYFLAGTVVLLTLLFVGWVMAQMTGRSADVVEYQTRYENVHGLNFGTPVFFQGFRVGQVERIEPEMHVDGMFFRVWLSVDEHWRIPVDSKAVLTSSGLLADVYIEIERGRSETHLQPGEMLAGSQVVDVFAAFSELADEAVKLTRDGLQPLIGLLNQRLDGITRELAEQTPLILRDARQTVASLKQAGTQVERLLDEGNRQRLDGMIADAAATAANLRRLSERMDESRRLLEALLTDLQGSAEENRPEIRQAVLHLRNVLDQLDLQVDDILRNLDSASGNLDAFSRAIYKDPSRLLRTAPQTKEP